MRDHCCEEMHGHLQVVTEPSPWVVDDRPVVYDAIFDEYRLASADGMPDRALITRCPWCGACLPPSKRDLWFAELARLGLTPDDPALPARFLRPGWWRRAESGTADRPGPA
jgi:hypothetical protein